MGDRDTKSMKEKEASVNAWRDAHPGMLHPLENAGQAYEETYHYPEDVVDEHAASALAELDEGAIVLDGGFTIQEDEGEPGRYVIAEPTHGIPVGYVSRDDDSTLAALCKMIDANEAVPERLQQMPQVAEDDVNVIFEDSDFEADYLNGVGVEAFGIAPEPTADDLIPGDILAAEEEAKFKLAVQDYLMPDFEDEPVQAAPVAEPVVQVSEPTEPPFDVEPSAEPETPAKTETTAKSAEEKLHQRVVDMFRGGQITVIQNGITIADFDGISSNDRCDVSELSDTDLLGLYDDVIEGNALCESDVPSVADEINQHRDMYNDMQLLPFSVLKSAGLTDVTPLDLVQSVSDMAKSKDASVPSWFVEKYTDAPQETPAKRGATKSASKSKAQSSGKTQSKGSRGRIGATQAIGGLRPRRETMPDGRTLPSAFHSRKNDDRLAVTFRVSLQGENHPATVLVKKGENAVVIRDRMMPGRDCLMLQPDTRYDVELGYKAGSEPQGLPVVGRSKNNERVYVGASMSGREIKQAHDEAMKSKVSERVYASDEASASSTYPSLDSVMKSGQEDPSLG